MKTTGLTAGLATALSCHMAKAMAAMPGSLGIGHVDGELEDTTVTDAGLESLRPAKAGRS